MAKASLGGMSFTSLSTQYRSKSFNQYQCDPGSRNGFLLEETL
jgi:hypothetical protein